MDRKGKSTSSVGAEEVVGHVGVEVEVVGVIEEIPLLGGMLELLVVVVDDAHPVGLAVRQVAWQVAADSCPKKGWDPPGGWQMVLVDVIQYLLIFKARLCGSILTCLICFDPLA